MGYATSWRGLQRTASVRLDACLTPIPARSDIGPKGTLHRRVAAPSETASPPACSMRFLSRALLFSLGIPAAHAQDASPPRYGVGFDFAFPVLGDALLPDGLSIGLRGRGALPINADLSVAASLGVGAHLFANDEPTRYVLNPQASLIVMLPGESPNVRYVLGGFGGFVPLSGGQGGPAIHGGYGMAFPLRQTSLFIEANPSLIIGEDETGFVLAARAGVIF